MRHRAWSSAEEAPIAFQGYPSSFKVTWGKKSTIFTRIANYLYFEFNDGRESMHKAYRSIGEESYYFSSSSVKFQGHIGQNSILTQIVCLNSPMT